MVIATGWSYADPIAGLLIGVLVALSPAGVLRETVGVLLEGAPAGMDAREVGAAIASTPGVVGVHDLHLGRRGQSRGQSPNGCVTRVRRECDARG